MHCRLAEGIRLYRSLPGSHLILCGGILREGDRAVSCIMADFLKEMGVPGEDIRTEERSRNTFENLLELKRTFGSAPFILVTSGYALRRAMAVAKKLGMEPVPAPACMWALQKYPLGKGWAKWSLWVLNGMFSYSPNRWKYLQVSYHEYLGYVWYKLLGRI
jgi:uncharacterized SAM-binding protein YcdF (DUF218 family)